MERGYLRRYNYYIMSYVENRNIVVRHPGGQEIYLFCKAARPVVMPTQPTILRASAAHFPEVVTEV